MVMVEYLGHEIGNPRYVSSFLFLCQISFLGGVLNPFGAPEPPTLNPSNFVKKGFPVVKALIS